LEKFEMKKSLIAMAVLAASGAAMAQSSVTLYGIADVWVGSVEKDQDAGLRADGTIGVATSTSTTSMISGGVSTSRWGMKGSEDLGGGLKANFQYEAGVSVDTGASADFTRQAWVGVSGGFGDVRFGKISSPYDNNSGTSNAVFDSDLAPTNGPGGAVFASGDYVSKVNNAIYYKTPSMGGFAADVMYSLDEDAAKPAVLANPVTFTPAVDAVDAVSVTGAGLTYAGGPFAAQFVYQKDDYQFKANDETFMRLGASYNLGVAKIKAIYANVDNTNNTTGSTDEWMLGADVPFGAATLSASYASSTDDAAVNPVLGEVERTGYGAAVAYSLSKRTTVYGGAKYVQDDQGAGADIDYTVYAVGIKHAF